jgi:hypothetical protein
VTEPPSRSQPAVHRRLAGSVQVPIGLASADEWPLVSYQADPQGVSPLPAAPLAQAHALPASPALDGGFQLL